MVANRRHTGANPLSGERPGDPGAAGPKAGDADRPSLDGDGQENLNFRYNRERRLERAPEIVRETYRRGYTPNKGFLKGLTATPGLRSVFFAIILLSSVIVGVTLFSDNPDTGRFEGATARLKVFLYGDNVYASVTFEPGKTLPSEPVPVSAAIEGIDAGGNSTITQYVAGVYAGETYALRAALRDYELVKVRALVRYGDREAELAASVDRN